MVGLIVCFLGYGAVFFVDFWAAFAVVFGFIVVGVWVVVVVLLASVACGLLVVGYCLVVLSVFWGYVVVFRLGLWDLHFAVWIVRLLLHYFVGC